MLLALGGLGIMLPMSLTTLIVTMFTTGLVVQALNNKSQEQFYSAFGSWVYYSLAIFNIFTMLALFTVVFMT